MDFTFQQKLTMTIGFVGAATSAFGALNPLMTSTESLIGTVIFGFVTACLGVVSTVTNSIAQQVKTVAALPGVDRVVLNTNASMAVAQVGTDAGQPKVGGADAATQATLKEIAKGNS